MQRVGVVLVPRRRIVVALAASMNMGSRRMACRLCSTHCVRVREPKALVGQQQRNEQKADESSDHV